MKYIKFILLCCFIFIISCRKITTLPQQTTQKIFSVSESNISDGQLIYFDLPLSGTYTLTLIDKTTGQVISKEKFNGLSGENIKKIYTKSIKSKTLYLLLEDVNKTELNKTTINLN